MENLMRTQSFIAASSLALAIALGGCKSNSGSDEKNASSTALNGMTAEQVRSAAYDAYVFTYPLVLNYRTMYLQAVDAQSREYVGGFGKYRHYGMSSPDNKDIVTPNNDTPYSWAQLDLRTEPWVLIQPPTDGRYFTAQWDDMWGYVLDNPGAVLDGNSGGSYLLVSRAGAEKPQKESSESFVARATFSALLPVRA